MILVYQSKAHQLTTRVRHGVMSVAELVSLSEPVPIDGLTYETTGVLPQALVEEFVGTQHGQVVHFPKFSRESFRSILTA